MPSATRPPAAPSPATSTSAPSRNVAPTPPRATDDEILGIVSPRKNPPRDTQQLEFDFDAADASDSADGLRTAGTFSDALAALPAPLPSAQNDNSNTPVAHAANAQATTIPEPAHLRATSAPPSTPTLNCAPPGATPPPTANPSPRPTPPAKPPRSWPTSITWTRSSSRAAPKTTPHSPAPSPI